MCMLFTINITFCKKSVHVLYCNFLLFLLLGGSPVTLRQSYHNYALSECGAKVLESNKEAKVSYSTYITSKWREGA